MIYFVAGNSSSKKIAVADNAKIFNGTINNSGSDIVFELVQGNNEKELSNGQHVLEMNQISGIKPFVGFVNTNNNIFAFINGGLFAGCGLFDL